jgi:hypothetical protein
MANTYFKCIDNTGNWSPDLKATCPGAASVPCLAKVLQPVKYQVKSNFKIGGKR